MFIGIDLGTSNSCASYIRDGKPIMVSDEKGRVIHPSYVNISEDFKVDVGWNAKYKSLTDPENTAHSLKRLIGRKFDSPEVEKTKSMTFYDIVSDKENNPAIKIRNRLFSVQELTSYILKKMKILSETVLEKEVDKAVITVPAYFNDGQRQATKDAATIVGLKVLRIINEPTSAALAYGYGKGKKEKLVVYDFGGGTFDVSILSIGLNVYEVLSTSGDTFLGGDDFDRTIKEYILEEVAKISQQLTRDRRILLWSSQIAEVTKWKLNEVNYLKLTLPELEKKEKSEPMTVSLNKNSFNDRIKEHIKRSILITQEALEMANLSFDEVDGVLLIGGSTKMKLIREYIAQYFQKTTLHSINPDEAVAQGAAIQAASLVDATSDHVLIDVTPLELSIATVGGYVEKIIEANTPIPVENTKMFTTTTDYQENVNINVFQGNSEFAHQNELLGSFAFSGFRPQKRGDVEIAVTFEIDTNGILNVSAQDTGSGQKQKVVIKNSSRMTEDQIEELKRGNLRLK